MSTQIRTAIQGDGTNGATGILGTSDSGPGVIGETASTKDSGMLGRNTGSGPGASGTSQGGVGVSASSTDGIGLYAISDNKSAASFEITNTTNSEAVLQVTAAGGGTGINCTSKGGIGISGQSTDNSGVNGNSTNKEGVVGTGGKIGVKGVSNSPNGIGVLGQADNGLAGNFIGNVEVQGKLTVLQDLTVQGTLTKSAGTFKIDHPLDPARKYLSHAFVESAEMKNIYDGIVVLDAYGEATVELPRWFEALNGDFRYQLTCLGSYAPVYIAAEIQDGRFKIAGGKSGLKVCWMVTGIRHDPYAQAHPLIVEQEKEEQELGIYRHRELYD